MSEQMRRLMGTPGGICFLINGMCWYEGRELPGRLAAAMCAASLTHAYCNTPTPLGRLAANLFADRVTEIVGTLNATAIRELAEYIEANEYDFPDEATPALVQLHNPRF